MPPCPAAPAPRRSPQPAHVWSARGGVMKLPYAHPAPASSRSGSAVGSRCIKYVEQGLHEVLRSCLVKRSDFCAGRRCRTLASMAWWKYSKGHRAILTQVLPANPASGIGHRRRHYPRRRVLPWRGFWCNMTIQLSKEKRPMTDTLSLLDLGSSSPKPKPAPSTWRPADLQTPGQVERRLRQEPLPRVPWLHRREAPFNRVISFSLNRCALREAESIDIRETFSITSCARVQRPRVAVRARRNLHMPMLDRSRRSGKSM